MEKEKILWNPQRDPEIGYSKTLRVLWICSGCGQEHEVKISYNKGKAMGFSITCPVCMEYHTTAKVWWEEQLVCELEGDLPECEARYGET